jgi:hypothetical protein
MVFWYFGAHFAQQPQNKKQICRHSHTTLRNVSRAIFGRVTSSSGSLNGCGNRLILIALRWLIFIISTKTINASLQYLLIHKCLQINIVCLEEVSGTPIDFSAESSPPPPPPHTHTKHSPSNATSCHVCCIRKVVPRSKNRCLEACKHGMLGPLRLVLNSGFNGGGQIVQS